MSETDTDEDDGEAPIEERALRGILGNQAIIMRALAHLMEVRTDLAGWKYQQELLRNRALQIEEWKNAHLRN